MLTLSEAVEDLYRVAVEEGRTQAANRMQSFGDLCVQELDVRSVNGVKKEVRIPGIGRAKKWDVAWSNAGNVRMAISLKSMLRNTGGSAPNRADDLMGEMANVQLRSPEIVTGYLTVFAVNESRRDGRRWVDVFRSYVDPLSGRRAPAWDPGTVEALSVVEVDFSERARLLAPSSLDEFFDLIVARLRERNPCAVNRGAQT